ncbi:MAG TPA: bifunctional phosphopantothenoylcysteine decarboxylase/phosphopantothenate--cysteine ligase CoaBC [Haliangiales bacterium]|nr:bifunctional phosphopantothenoylcysteine decarboxylase/phosphopantothenate--cysteine ligase CoaBC [Haliangiales bacterium]
MADSRAFPLRDRRVVLGVGGGIAAYKAAELVRLLTKAGASVRVMMTRGATEFVAPLTFQTLSGHLVATELFDLTQESEIGHIQLADQADLVILAPATADLIGRAAAGLGDDIVATVLLATRAPILIAPSMNVNMWENPLVQANLRRLMDVRGAKVAAPGVGFLACRWVGPGRLAEPADIVEHAGRMLIPHDLAGVRVAVTAGPTHEDIDPVRFLGNRSSGRMGYAIARAAAARGADVTLVSGPTALADPLGVETVRVRSALEMMDAIPASPDVVVMAAAVADYKMREIAVGKLKKEALGDSPALHLSRNPDILTELARARTGRPVLVGFAAETSDVEENALRKLNTKGSDLVVANDVSAKDAGFEVDTNRVTIVGPGDAVERLPLATKDEVAHVVLDRAAALLSTKGTSRTPG